MIFASSIGTILTFAGLPARYTRIEALTILFLALALLAVATFANMFGTLQLMTHMFSGFADLVLVKLVIRAAIAGALFCAHFAFSEALAIHLEAFCFFASATVFLFFSDRSRGHHFILWSIEVVIDRELLIFLNQLFRDVLIKADSGVERKVLLRLDKLKGMGNIGNGRYPKETLTQ